MKTTLFAGSHSPAACLRSLRPLRLAAVLLSSCVALSAAPSVSEALASLKDGQARFNSGHATHPNLTRERLAETAGGQHPFATVLTCSDSRVSPELVFDQGIGDVFVIRVAGNVARTDELGSIEYGVDHLGTPILVVLGHSSCGAVTAVLENAPVHGNIPALLEPIKAPVARAKHDHADLHGAELLAKAVELNVWQSIADILARSDAVRERVEAGKLKVVGAVYDLHDGTVHFLGEHPHQADLLKQAPSTSVHH
jgi:carbonic anhydrase